MEDINIKIAQKLTSPNPFCLITTSMPDQGTNIMALSWWTYVSNNPATVAICLSKKGYSNELINLNREFSMCFVIEDLREAAMKCGQTSGRRTNKAEQFNIELQPAKIIKPQVVKHSRMVFECKVTNTVDCGDHDIFIANILNLYGNPDGKHLFSLEGYSCLSAI